MEAALIIETVFTSRYLFIKRYREVIPLWKPIPNTSSRFPSSVSTTTVFSVVTETITFSSNDNFFVTRKCYYSSSPKGEMTENQSSVTIIEDWFSLMVSSIRLLGTPLSSMRIIAHERVNSNSK